MLPSAVATPLPRHRHRHANLQTKVALPPFVSTRAPVTRALVRRTHSASRPNDNFLPSWRSWLLVLVLSCCCCCCRCYRCCCCWCRLWWLVAAVVVVVVVVGVGVVLLL